MTALLGLSLPTTLTGKLPVNSQARQRPMVKCSSERQTLFNRIAPVYDNLNDLLSLGQHLIWKKMAVSWSGGDLAFLLSEKVGSSGKVMGLDFSSEQLAVGLSSSSRLEMDWASEATMFDSLTVNPMALPLCWFSRGGPSSETSVRFIPCNTKILQAQCVKGR